MANTVGVKNPYRYRGYRYDTETRLYYLQSRYYNPEWGRFVNTDAIVGKTGKLLAHNMFAYCMNNPVNMVDPSGFEAYWGEFRKMEAELNRQEIIGIVKAAEPPNTNIPSAISGTLTTVVGSKTKKISAYTDADSIIRLYPSAQKIQPYLKGANFASKAFTVFTATLDISHTWDSNVKLTTSQRVTKTLVQIGGIAAGAAVGAIASGPLLAAGITAGGISFWGAVIGATAIDIGAGILINKGQDIIYKKLE